MGEQAGPDGTPPKALHFQVFLMVGSRDGGELGGPSSEHTFLLVYICHP